MTGGSPSPPGKLPIACALGASDGAARIERWRAVTAQSRAGVRRQATRLVLRYRGEPGVLDELRALAQAERECCAFAQWQVTERDGEVVLTISSDAEGIAALAGLFAAA